MNLFKVSNPLEPMILLQGFGVNGAWYQAHGVNIKGHNGIDLKIFHGQPVYATHDGVALYQVDANQGHGVVVITDQKYDYLGDADFGYSGGNAYMKTIYWHFCDPIKEPQFKSPLADKGAMYVKRGDIIGYADNTGFSTMDHLHFAVKPVTIGENLYTWGPVMVGNGYTGCIDPLPCLIDEILYKEELQKKIDLLTQIINLWKKILALRK